MPPNLTLYGHATCPGVPPVKALLWLSRIDYDYIDIHQDQAAAARVRQLNQGNESVPTLVFPDGTHLTEPKVADLKRKLESLGYRVGPLAWLVGNAWLIFVGVVVLFSLLRLFNVF